MNFMQGTLFILKQYNQPAAHYSPGLLDIEGQGEEDPDRRTDHHREEQEDQLQTVASPAEAAPPELVEIRLDGGIGDDSLLVALDQHVQECHLPAVHRLQNFSCNGGHGQWE